jgi:hypothetical protein
VSRQGEAQSLLKEHYQYEMAVWMAQQQMTISNKLVINNYGFGYSHSLHHITGLTSISLLQKQDSFYAAITTQESDLYYGCTERTGARHALAEPSQPTK